MATKKKTEKSETFDPELLRSAAANLAHNMTQQNVDRATHEKMAGQVRESLDKAQTITCESCGNHIFKSVVMLKRMSAILSPTGEEMIVPVQVFGCNKCGNVNKEFLPPHVISDVKKVDANGIPIY